MSATIVGSPPPEQSGVTEELCRSDYSSEKDSAAQTIYLLTRIVQKDREPRTLYHSEYLARTPAMIGLSTTCIPTRVGRLGPVQGQV